MTNSDDKLLLVRADVERNLGGAPRKDTVARRLAPVIDLINAARARGVAWAEISARLAAAGIFGADGRPLLVQTLSWAMRRLEERRADVSEPPKETRAAALQPRAPPGNPPVTPSEDEFIIPEVEAVLRRPASGAPSLPTRTIDEFLKEKKG
jgi:hypothetical protein